MTPRLTRTLLLAAGIAILVTALFHWFSQEWKERSIGEKLKLKAYKAQLTVQLGHPAEVAGHLEKVTGSLNILHERLAAARYKFDAKQENGNTYTFSFENVKDTAVLLSLLTNNGRLSMQEVYRIDALSASLFRVDTLLAQYFQAHPDDLMLQQRTASFYDHPLLSVLQPSRPYEGGMLPGHFAVIAVRDTALARQLLEHPAVAAYWPADIRFLYEDNRFTAIQGYATLYAIKNHPSRITNRNIVEVHVQVNGAAGEPVVIIELDPFGAVEFERLTAANVNKPLAICMDDKVVTAPNVNQKITGGHLQIISGGGEAGMEYSRMINVLLTGRELPLQPQVKQAVFTPYESLKPTIRNYVLLFVLSFALALGIQWLIIRLNASGSR